MSHRIRVKVTKKTNPVVAALAREGGKRKRERTGPNARGSNYTAPVFNFVRTATTPTRTEHSHNPHVNNESSMPVHLSTKKVMALAFLIAVSVITIAALIVSAAS